MGKKIEAILAEEFVCSRCKSSGAIVEKMAMSGVGISRLFDIQHHQYAFVSCDNCGYTEIFNLKVLGERDDLGTFVDILFSG